VDKYEWKKTFELQQGWTPFIGFYTRHWDRTRNSLSV